MLISVAACLSLTTQKLVKQAHISHKKAMKRKKDLSLHVQKGNTKKRTITRKTEKSNRNIESLSSMFLRYL